MAAGEVAAAARAHLVGLPLGSFWLNGPAHHWARSWSIGAASCPSAAGRPDVRRWGAIDSRLAERAERHKITVELTAQSNMRSPPVLITRRGRRRRRRNRGRQLGSVGLVVEPAIGFEIVIRVDQSSPLRRITGRYRFRDEPVVPVVAKHPILAIVDLVAGFIGSVKIKEETIDLGQRIIGVVGGQLARGRVVAERIGGING